MTCASAKAQIGKPIISIRSSYNRLTFQIKWLNEKSFLDKKYRVRFFWLSVGDSSAFDYRPSNLKAPIESLRFILRCRYFFSSYRVDALKIHGRDLFVKPCQLFSRNEIPRQVFGTFRWPLFSWPRCFRKVCLDSILCIFRSWSIFTAWLPDRERGPSKCLSCSDVVSRQCNILGEAGELIEVPSWHSWTL